MGKSSIESLCSKEKLECDHKVDDQGLGGAISKDPPEVVSTADLPVSVSEYFCGGMPVNWDKRLNPEDGYLLSQ